ncbi:Protein MPE1 [Meyerozyma sp. JA9]|nr:Protein MPE1 [Meyerozyma sp. JA9]
MSSTVFYRFLHQKEQSTVHFDGTGISVFDLKHEIIEQNSLGSGTDFNLRLYHSEQPDLEYENDQDVITRSSFVLARRSPPGSKIGFIGNASRYVSGKPRVNKKAIQGAAAAPVNPVSTVAINENMTEEERTKAMFENQSNVWAQIQDDLSTHKVIYNKPAAGPTNPEDVPPPGYMCYRCGGKDHWIKNCPTNTDPNFEGKKIKRTTGIPRSYLKTLSKEAVERLQSSDSSVTTNENGDLVDQQGNTYMISETGEYVLTMADTKTWSTYQEKQQSAAMKARREYDEKMVAAAEKDQHPLYVDPLSTSGRKLLAPPIVMTPCCQDASKLKKLRNFNYHQPSLESALIDNDFHCPNCDQEDVFIDSLIRNEELEKEIEAYVEEKEKELGLENPYKRKSEENGSDPKRQRPAGSMPAPAMPYGMPMMMNPNMPMPPPMMFGMPPMPPAQSK